jgi:hypothetical protein
MSLEIDLFNTYSVCGHEPHRESHDTMRPIRRDGRPSSRIDSGTRPTDVIASFSAGRSGERGTDGDAPVGR